MIVGGLWIDEIRDPVCGARVVGLADLDRVSVVIGCRDRRESGVFDALGQPTEPTEEIDGDEGVGVSAIARYDDLSSKYISRIRDGKGPLDAQPGCRLRLWSAGRQREARRRWGGGLRGYDRRGRDRGLGAVDGCVHVGEGQHDQHEDNAAQERAESP